MASNFRPAPGPQQPGKYGGRVGPNYGRYGEQPGFVYYAPTDSYFRDPKYEREYAEQQGYAQKKPEEPGLGETLLPLAAAGFAMNASSGLAKDPSAYLGGLWKGGKEAVGQAQGLLGLGGEGVKDVASPIATTAARTGSQVLSSSLPTSTGAAGEIGLSGAAAEQAGLSAAQQGLEQAPGLFSLNSGGLLAEGSALPIANYVPGIAGAYGAYDLFTNDRGPVGGALQGAASGAGIGFTVGGPVGAGIGAGIGAVVGGVKGLFEHESTKDVQKKREKGLASKDPNYAAFHQQLLANRDSHPEIKDGYNPNAAPGFIGVDPSSGVWTNNKFAESHNAADLQAEDIWGTPDFFKQYPDWLQKSEGERRQIADTALQSGAVTTKKGGIYVDFKKVGTGGESPADAAVAAAPGLMGMISAPKAPTGKPPQTMMLNGKPVQVSGMSPEWLAQEQQIRGTGQAPRPLDPMFTQAPAVNSSGGIRVSPGVYKDAKTGATYLSKSGSR